MATDFFLEDAKIVGHTEAPMGRVHVEIPLDPHVQIVPAYIDGSTHYVGAGCYMRAPDRLDILQTNIFVRPRGGDTLASMWWDGSDQPPPEEFCDCGRH